MSTPSAWGTSKGTRHELPGVQRAPLRVPRPGAHPGGGGGDPAAYRRVPSLRGELRFRKGVSHIRACALPRARRLSRIASPHTGRAARRVKWLTRDGLIAACAVGAGTTWGLGWGGLALLGAFLLFGSFLTQLAERQGPPRTPPQAPAHGRLGTDTAPFGALHAASRATAAPPARTSGTPR